MAGKKEKWREEKKCSPAPPQQNKPAISVCTMTMMHVAKSEDDTVCTVSSCIPHYRLIDAEEISENGGGSGRY